MPSFVNVFGGTAIQPSDVSYREIDLVENITLSWPLSYVTTETVVASLMDVTVSTTGLSITMPPANQVSVGQSVIFKNTGSEIFSVLDNDSNEIIQIDTGKAFYIYVTDNSSEKGVWGVTHYGTGTSNADATTLAGYGLWANSGKLNTNSPVIIKINNFDIEAADRAQTIVWQGGSGLVNLPTLPDGFYFNFNNNSNAGNVTFSPVSGSTINGFTTKTIGSDDSATFITDGSNWFTIGYGKSTYYSIEVLSKDVSGSNNYELNQTEAQKLIQIFTGTLTGNVTVYYPVVNYNAYITNSTTGSYSLYIRLGTQSNPVGTPLEISQNARIIVYSDSNQFYPVPTELPEATAFQDGSEADPSITFVNDTSTGFYKPSTGTINITSSGNEIVSFSSNAIDSKIPFLEKGVSIYSVMMGLS